jgi:dihydropyrimidinase
MNNKELLIKNCNIVTSKKTYLSDILIENGKIVDIANTIENISACKEIDAKKQYAFPGGIDPHVHMHLPTFAGFSSDNFYTGSKAALFGGTTTIIDFVTPKKKQSLVEALSERKKEAEKSLTDYSFHVSPIDWHEGIENEIYV